MTEPLLRNTSTLPGIRFEAQPSRLQEVLPRLDIPAFVGFCSSGPVHRPVAIEDLARFRELFGPDVALAWDPQRESVRHSHLGPAVEAFFRNGGRRCWVVRVAADPTQIEVPIPGLVETDGSAPVLARARAAGSWADDLLAVTRLERADLELLATPAPPAPGAPYSFDVAAGETELEIGDLLELVVDDGGPRLLAFVAAQAAVAGGRRVVAREVFWTDYEMTSPPQEAERRFELIDEADGLALWSGAIAGSPAGQPLLRRLRFTLTASRSSGAASSLGDLAFHRDHPRFFASLPHDDELFRPTIGRRQAPRPLREVELEEEASTPRFALAGPSAPTPAYLPLNLELDGGSAEPAGATASPPLVEPGVTRLERDGLVEFGRGLFIDPRLEANRADTVVRDGEYWYYDREADLTGIHSLLVVGEVTLLAAPDAVHRGWTRELPPFSPGLAAPHLEPIDTLSPEGCWTVSWSEVSEAREYLLERSEDPSFERRVEVYRGSEPETCLELGVECPQIAFFRVRAETPEALSPWSNSRRAETPPQPFRDCDEVVPPELELAAQIVGSPGEQIELSWTVDPAGIGSEPPISPTSPADLGVFETEIAMASEVTFSHSELLATVSGTSFLLDSVSDSLRYVRVRSRHGEVVGPWSNTVTVLPSQRSAWTLLPESEWTQGDLLAVHRAMLRLSGARRDLLSVLSLPGHFRAREALEYLGTLESAESTTVFAGVPPFSQTELWILGYGAMVHPWLTTRPGTGDRDELELRWGPADGSVCGVLADVTLREGAWISPGNRALRGVLALAPELAAEEWSALTRSGINVVVQDPRGFLLSNSDTLTAERAVQPLNVRRLLILVRRLVLREGASYVFEPHGDDLRSRIRHRFERVFSNLYVRGAFVGDLPSLAYRVVAGETVNPPGSVERGRLFVELQFAPSHPLVFLKLRLLQTAPGELSLQEL